MVKVEMNGFTVTNVEPCPKCKGEKYAKIDNPMNIVQIACDECEYVTGGGLYMLGSANVHTEKDKFIKMTRDMFNFWNESVANLNNVKVKKVRIILEKPKG